MSASIDRICLRNNIFSLLTLTLTLALSASTFGTVRAADAYRWNLNDAALTLSDTGESQLFRADGTPFASAGRAFRFTTVSGEQVFPTKVTPKERRGDADVFDVTFEDGSVATYSAVPGDGFLLVNLEELRAKSAMDASVVFMMNVPYQQSIPGWINTTKLADGSRLGVMTTSVNVIPASSSCGAYRADKEGCSHTFRLLESADSDSETPASVAEFCAESKRTEEDGWSVRGKRFVKSLDLSKRIRIRARVCGDGKGEQLKIQLAGASGHRDDYIDVDFTGWKICELDSPALDDISYNRVEALNLYYNGLPADSQVRCLVDWIDVVLDDGKGGETSVRLEDFSEESFVLWDEVQSNVSAKSFERHKIYPASCAVIATNDDRWATVVEAMQKKAGVPSPRPGNGWRGASPNVHESYFFLTSFNASEYDAALAIAKRGGFKQVLIVQDSWCQSTGTYHVNERNFPGGFPKLKEIAESFNKEGIRFGLHLLAASVDSNDPYITPVPDPRFLTDVSAKLAADLDGDENSTTILTSSDGNIFPTGEEVYMGSGQVVRIDDELIEYGRTEESGLYECKRGLYGTHIAAHGKGATVAHFTRSYGYHKPDLDTDFIDEVAGNFAKLANELPIDMLYFDGSELLQRPNEGYDQWYYNARLHKAFYDKLANKDVLIQGSSCSPFSWHMISRNASADGHDDLKAYLEERSGRFDVTHPEDSWLDVGWYYAYDRNATPDMYEYCLGATIAYDASFSFQTAVRSAMIHPFIGEILDLIREYENLRLSGRIPEEMRARFEIDKRLAGIKSVGERNALLGLRHEYHLEKNADGKQMFRRVSYPVWHNVGAGLIELGGTTMNDAKEENGVYTWELTVDTPSRVGFQTHFKSEDTIPEGLKLVNPKVAFTRIDNGVEENVGSIEMKCQFGIAQFAFALPGQPETLYGYPIMEPETLGVETPDLWLEPGVYRVSFEAESGLEAPIRVRTPLYTDETYVIPD